MHPDYSDALEKRKDWPVEGPITSFNGEYRFLSNFYPVNVRYANTTFPTVEHAYQAAKIKEGEHEWFSKFVHAKTPGEAKRLGRKVPLRADWDEVKDAVMLDLLRQKFDPQLSTTLCRALLQTWPKKLIEGNTWGDRYWGVCNGHGRNMLGVLLMQVRDEIWCNVRFIIGSRHLT